MKSVFFLMRISGIAIIIKISTKKDTVPRRKKNHSNQFGN